MEAEAEVETSVAYAARQVNLRRSCVAGRCAMGGAAHLSDEVGEGSRAELADAHAYELRLPRRRRVEEERRRRLSGSCTKSARPAHMPDIRAKELVLQMHQAAAMSDRPHVLSGHICLQTCIRKSQVDRLSCSSVSAVPPSWIFHAAEGTMDASSISRRRSRPR